MPAPSSALIHAWSQCLRSEQRQFLGVRGCDLRFFFGVFFAFFVLVLGASSFGCALADYVSVDCSPAASAALFLASLDESMGEIWFWQVAEVVIEGGFVGFLRSKTVRFSGDQF